MPRETSKEWIHDDRERKLLDLTFLTVTAKKYKNASKREDVYNGTKKSLIQLFNSEVGDTFYYAPFKELWLEFMDKTPDQHKRKEYEKYFASIIRN